MKKEKPKGRGTVYQIKSGIFKGVYCVAYSKERIEYYEKIGRLFVHLFLDKECTDPFLDENNKKLCTIIELKELARLGFLKKQS